MNGLREQLEAVRAKRGELTPPGVVDEARDPAHPLHARFEWDNEVAGERYRLVQARELIQSVRVTYTNPRGKTSDVRGFQSVRRESGWVYEPSSEVAQDPVTRSVVLAEMEREWRSLHARYSQFEEFTAMVQASLRDAA